MKNYLHLLSNVIENGEEKKDRTGIGTKSIFGWQMKFDLSKGFPLITTKKLHIKSIIHELLWFINGKTNIKYLNENGVRIWDEWADKNGDLGPVYGKQWREWNKTDGKFIDQLSEVIEEIKINPYSRRLIVSSWNPEDIPKMALAPCHCFYQFYVNNSKLSCQLYQRSADVFLGVPFNIASYALLTEMVACVTNLVPKDLIITFGDAHIYNNHIDQVNVQLKRSPKQLPNIDLNNKKLITDFNYSDIKISNYNPYPHISGKVAI